MIIMQNHSGFCLGGIQPPLPHSIAKVLPSPPFLKISLPLGTAQYPCTSPPLSFQLTFATLNKFSK